MDFGNIFDFLNRRQKHIAFSFLLSLHIAYVYLYRFGDNVDARIIDFANTFCIAMCFIGVNYIAAIFSMLVLNIKIRHSYVQFLFPQLVSVCMSMLIQNPSITPLRVFWTFCVVSFFSNFAAALAVRMFIIRKRIDDIIANDEKNRHNKKHNKKNRV